MSKWFVIRGNNFDRITRQWLPGAIVEEDSVGENDTEILFPCSEDFKDVYPDGIAHVSKVYIGCDYFRTREEAQARIDANTPPSPIVLIEPSDSERATWSDITRKYVESLENFYDKRR